MKESFWSPAPSPTLSFGEQCKWDVDEWSEHQLVSLGCSKLQLWASGISPEQDQHKNYFLISRQPLQAALGIGWNFTAASVTLESSPLTLCTSQPIHASGSRDHSNLELSSSPPRRYSCLENPMDGGAWWAAVHGVAKSRTRLSDFTFTFHFPALEKEMATHSSVLAWRIPGTGEPGGLLLCQSECFVPSTVVC